MRTTRKSLAGLQARAQAAAARRAENRVVVTRSATPAADGDDTPAAEYAELWLYGTVGGYWWGFDSDEVAAELRVMGDVDEILVRLHSFGGSAIEGIAIANLLANHPAKVRIVVDGLAASAASMIALSGAELIMSPGSQLMIHDAWMWTAGNEAELIADAAWIGKQSQNYAETYAHRAGGTAEQWRRDVMLANDGDGRWYSAQEAVDAGLADSVANITSLTPPPPMPDPVDLDDLEAAAAALYDFEVLTHPAVQSAWSSWRRTPGAPKPPTASAGGSTNTEGGLAVTFTDAQLDTMRTTLELPADADEAAILAAVQAVVEDSLDSTTPPAAPSAAQVPEGMSLIETEVLNSLRQGAAAGAAARTQQLTEHRDRTIAKAIADGKITPARKQHFEASWKADPEGTEQLLASLEPGLVPTEERGHAQPPAENVNTQVDLGDYAAGLGLTEEDLR